MCCRLLCRELPPALQEARLGGPTPPKELGKLYSAILDLLCGQLDVLRPATSPSQAPELAAALRALEDLRAALAARLQVARAGPIRKGQAGSGSQPLCLVAIAGNSLHRQGLLPAGPAFQLWATHRFDRFSLVACPVCCRRCRRRRSPS